MSSLTTNTPVPIPDAGSRQHPAILVALIVVLVAAVAAMFLPVDRAVVGVAGLVAMLALLFLKVPVAFALWIPSLAGMLAMSGFRRVESTLSTMPYAEVASWTLSVVPMFVLMGLLLASSGIAQSMYGAARNWLWWMPGSLAVGTNIAGTGLASVTGSSIGTTYAIARVGIPEMLRAGYSKRFAIVAVMSASLPGQLIPPSILLIVYAGVAETAVGPQLLAGIGPGLLVSIMFSLILVSLALLRPRLSGGARLGTRPTARALWTSIAPVWPVPVLMAIVIFGMFFGFFTATEAGAVAAVVAMLIVLLLRRRSKPLGQIAEAAKGTVSSTGQIFLLLIGAMAFSEMLTQSGVTRVFADWVTDAGFDRVTFLLLMTVVYVILGMAMESLSMILLTVPLLLPTLIELDISLIWFGVFVVLMAELGILTPPVGILSFVLYGVLKDKTVNLGHGITLRDVFVSALWVVPGVVGVVLMLIFWPDIVTFIPGLMSPGG